MRQQNGTRGFGNVSGRWVISGMAAILLNGFPARAANEDVRQYQITVDNKRAGNSLLTIRDQGEEGILLSRQADVRVSIGGIIGYRFASHGSEVWKDGRLLRMESVCQHGMKRYAVTAGAERGAVRVRVNDQDRLVNQNVWTTSYWRLPEARYRNRSLPILDGDTGREILARLEYLGVDRVNVAGELQNCTHYRLSGGVQADLWYDLQERLVRQESVEQGHRTVLEMVRPASVLPASASTPGR